jgi:hypothetical protein
MLDARHLRAQARLYLNLAERNSQSWEAPTLRTIAAEYISDAEKLETRADSSQFDPYPAFVK